MAVQKTERLLNLTIALLTTSRYLTKYQISRLFYDSDNDVSFERQFERDKNELREMGMKIVTGRNNFADDEIGYRIDPNSTLLPPVEITAAEAAVLGVASRVWQHSAVSETVQQAFRKLKAAGIETSSEHLEMLTPVFHTNARYFDVIWEKTFAHQTIKFEYRNRPEVRKVQPWRVYGRVGQWYLIGFDIDRQDHRMFKISRITSEPKPVGKPGGYQIPNKEKLDELCRGAEPAIAKKQALVAIRNRRAPSLQRNAKLAQVNRQDIPEDYECYWVPYALTADLVSEICAVGPDAVVLEPDNLKQQVINQLKNIVKGG